MAGKIKGIYKGLKSISQIFVVKEREMEIGQPTDVIHVAHFGVDHSSAVAPSWMKEFKISPDKTTNSSDNAKVSHPTALSTRSSQGIGQLREPELRTQKMRNHSCTDLSNVTEKRKRRRKSTSVAESSSTKSRRLSKIKTTFTELGSSSNFRI